MKEFKKWLLTDEGQILVGDHHAKAAWRAAMEQVLLWGSDDDILFNKIKDEIYGE